MLFINSCKKADGENNSGLIPKKTKKATYNGWDTDQADIHLLLKHEKWFNPAFCI